LFCAIPSGGVVAEFTKIWQNLQKLHPRAFCSCRNGRFFVNLQPETIKRKKIMPQLFTLFGLRFMFYSNDHEPIHVHVVKGGAEARFQVQPEVTLLDNRGLKPAELKLAESIVEENKEIIAARWNEYFKNQK